MDVARVAELAHEAGALAWVDAVHYAPHGPIDVAAIGADVLICSPYKFFGPHLGLAFARSELLERWRPYKVRPAADEPLGHRFETGTLPHELLAGFVAACEYVDSVGMDAIVGYEHELGARFLAGLPDSCRLYGLPTMEGRVPTFCFNVEGLTPLEAASRLGERGFGVWRGNYYAVEVMKRLGLPEGAVRAGIVHYNTEQEVDALLTELQRAVRLLVLGGTKFLGRATVEAALERGHEVTLFNRGETNPELFPEGEKLRGDRDGDLSALEGREWDAVIDPSGFVPRLVRASAEALQGSVGQYLFVSSISVYDELGEPGFDETARTVTLEDPTTEDYLTMGPVNTYGGLKALCEEVVREVFPDSHAVVRPGLIVGTARPERTVHLLATPAGQGR